MARLVSVSGGEGLGVKERVGRREGAAREARMIGLGGVKDRLEGGDESELTCSSRNGTRRKLGPTYVLS